MPITIPSEYGYVIGVGAASVFFMTYLGFKVGAARRKAGVPYPYMYADKKEADESKDKYVFNCVQRAHQNTLENYPGFLLVLLSGGIEHPKMAAASGALFLIGRYVYAAGYSTGEPKKRLSGSFAFIGLLSLLGLSFKAATNLVVGVGAASVFFMTYLGFKVGAARRKAGIPYPYMYAEKKEAEENKDKH
ncbi:Microsomal glutathione S-transferase 3, partial [Dinochytrium kinnereticum]